MSKVIFKMSYKHINLKSTQGKNSAHVNYIATRVGVDKTLSEADFKKEIEKGSSTDENYASYINNRPRSHGLFGPDGIENLKEIQEELENTQGFVWRAIVSLREEDALNLGYDNKEKWQDVIRNQMPEIAVNMNIDIINFKWTAAVHMEKGHPHAHIMFWEKEPKHYRGKVNQSVITKIRKGFTDEIFEAERFNLLQEKNNMRDLVGDLAEEDISKVVRQVKDVKEEIKGYMKETNTPGITPRLHSNYEKELTQMLEELSEKLPKRGRMSYQYMPQDIKQEVDKITEYLFKKDVLESSLEKGLMATEELTKLYTGKENQIKEARDNAYEDIKKRVSQLVIKGSLEFQKKNNFYVNLEFADQAVNFIKGANNTIDKQLEEEKVFKQIGTILNQLDYKEQEIKDILEKWGVENDISLDHEDIDFLVKDIKKGSDDKKVLISSQNIDHYIAVLKTLGFNEEETFENINVLIEKNKSDLELELGELVSKGMLKNNSSFYELTNKGANELLKVKDLNVAEKEIINSIIKEEKLNFEELASKEKIITSLYNKDIREIEIGKFDYSIYNKYFGENNLLKVNEIKNKVEEKYTHNMLQEDSEKIDKEIDVLKSRLDKLLLNGYVQLNKEKGEYSFTKEGLESLDKVNRNIEFTKYDANVTLGYIDREEGLLTKNKLKEICSQEFTNKQLQRETSDIEQLIENPPIDFDKYIKIDKEGNIDSTDDGRQLNKEINQLEWYLYKTSNKLTHKELEKLLVKKGEKTTISAEYTKAINLINKAIKYEYIGKNEETGIYILNENIQTISKLSYRISQEGSSINKTNLEEVLKKHIPNKEAERQYGYITRKLDFLKQEGYLEGNGNEYKLTSKGIIERKNLLEPRRDLLEKNLNYLKKLKLIENIDGRYAVTEKYYTYIKKVEVFKNQKEARISQDISKDIYKLIDRTDNKIEIEKIERNNKKAVIGKYINGEYEEFQKDYKAVRNAIGVSDITEKTVEDLAKTLLISGVSKEEVEIIIRDWNNRSNSNIDIDTINLNVEKAYQTFTDNSNWGNPSVIYKKEWNDIFKALDVGELEAPKWIYGKEWTNREFQTNSLSSTINNVWKGIWGELEKQRLQNEAQSQFMKKQLTKHQSMESKAARMEEIRKGKGSTFDMEDDFER